MFQKVFNICTVIAIVILAVLLYTKNCDCEPAVIVNCETPQIIVEVTVHQHVVLQATEVVDAVEILDIEPTLNVTPTVEVVPIKEVVPIEEVSTPHQHQNRNQNHNK